MGKIIFSIMMLTCVSIYAETIFLKPLWEEDRHFIHYRVLCIEGSIAQMENLILEAQINPRNICEILEKMQEEIQNCKNSL
jgi:hypothetical protein